MPIIKPSRVFEGSAVGGSTTTPYIREDVRKVVFNKTQNTNGVYLYFLPAYRVDSHGYGVWFKHIEIRDNFGDRYKEKYWVPSRAHDPAEYFAGHHKKLYSDESEVGTAVSNGKTFKKYPNYGRITKRVLYNVAYANKLQEGAHVLDLPQFNGASIITTWLQQTDISGNPRPLINDPEAAYPVFVRLLDSGTNPWQINVDASQPAVLPEQLALDENLYNLDEILVKKSDDEIIAKLRELYSSHVFEDCMDGFPGLTTGQVRGHSFAPPVAGSVVQPAPQTVSASQTTQMAPPPPPPPAPMKIPAARLQPVSTSNSAPVQPQTGRPGIPIQTVVPTRAAESSYVDPAELPPNPMAAMSSMTREQAEKFLAS